MQKKCMIHLLYYIIFVSKKHFLFLFRFSDREKNNKKNLSMHHILILHINNIRFKELHIIRFKFSYNITFK